MGENVEARKGERILIVDDTLQNIQVLGTVLREQNYQINVAQNGIQALEMVEKVEPDLILLDVMMPEMDGFEACQRLKADEKTREIPIIFLTAKVETEDVVHGFEIGAIDYVTKPFNAIELLARVKTHLELRRLRQELLEYNEQLEAKVAERTVEVQRAHKQLELQVRELDGRDRLAHAQMEVSSAGNGFEAILSVLRTVLNVDKAKIYLLDETGDELIPKAALGLDEPGQLQDEEDLVDLVPVATGDQDLVALSLADGKPMSGNDSDGAVPMIYGDTALGGIWVQGMRSDGVDEQGLMEVLWRLASEAALVCHAIKQSNALESGDIDVSALLDVEE